MTPPTMQALGITQQWPTTSWKATGYVEGIGWLAAWGPSLVAAMEALPALAARRVAEQAAHGVTMLGRANHAQTGSYTQTFFGLSIGLERMGKLIFLADHAIRNDGAFPTNEKLKKFSHILDPLLAKCEEIGAGLNQNQGYIARPRDAIHRGIEEVLSLFAIRLRYYNLDYLAGAAQAQQDSMALWWEKVAMPICARHYSQWLRERDDVAAVVMEKILGGISLAIHYTEAGEPIQDVQTFFARGRVTRLVQKYGRLYTLQIVRWFASIMSELSYRGAYEYRIQPLLGLDEPFTIFLNEDKYLRDRRTWSIYRP